MSDPKAALTQLQALNQSQSDGGADCKKFRLGKGWSLDACPRPCKGKLSTPLSQQGFDKSAYPTKAQFIFRFDNVEFVVVTGNQGDSPCLCYCKGY